MKITFTFAKETKNTYQFLASGTAITTLYINKIAFDGNKPPKTITVEVTW